MYPTPYSRLESYKSIKHIKISSIKFNSLAKIPSIVFFQSLLSSRLNSEKIRKFQIFFPNFSLPSRKNYKLKQALNIAYDQLRENKEDVSYFNLNFAIKKSNRKQKRQLKSSKSQQHQKGNQSEKIRYESQQIQRQSSKRKPGRPRKLSNQSPSLRPAISKNDKLEYTQPSLNNKSNSKLDDCPIIKKQQQILLSEDPSPSQQVISISKCSQSKPICKQIIKINRLINQRMYRQAMNLLINYKVTANNVIEILQYQFIKRLQEKINSKSLLKFKEKVQKILINRYFKNNQQCYYLHHREHTSIRGKVARRVFNLIKRQNYRQQKLLALSYEQKLRDECNYSNSEYMQKTLDLLNNLQINEQVSQIQK